MKIARSLGILVILGSVGENWCAKLVNLEHHHYDCQNDIKKPVTWCGTRNILFQLTQVNWENHKSIFEQGHKLSVQWDSDAVKNFIKPFSVDKVDTRKVRELSTHDVECAIAWIYHVLQASTTLLSAKLLPKIKAVDKVMKERTNFKEIPKECLDFVENTINGEHSTEDFGPIQMLEDLINVGLNMNMKTSAAHVHEFFKRMPAGAHFENYASMVAGAFTKYYGFIECWSEYNHSALEHEHNGMPTEEELNAMPADDGHKQIAAIQAKWKKLHFHPYNFSQNQ